MIRSKSKSIITDDFIDDLQVKYPRKFKKKLKKMGLTPKQYAMQEFKKKWKKIMEKTTSNIFVMPSQPLQFTFMHSLPLQYPDLPGMHLLINKET